MQTISVYSAHAAQAGLQEQKIAEGSLVNVRIISSNGEGKYTGIVAGARVNLKSDSVLQNGDVFKAKISIKNNTIFLKPVQNNNSIENNNKIQLDNFPLKLVENEELFSFFSRLGLPADNVMLNIFQMMKQLKMKMDIPLFLKIHNLSVRFGEKQKSASEILMILQKKGIPVSDETILDLKDYTHSLVVEEMNLGNLIENAVKQMAIEESKEEDDDIEEELSFEEIEALKDEDFEEYGDFIEEQEEDDEEMLRQIQEDR